MFQLDFLHYQKNFWSYIVKKKATNGVIDDSLVEAESSSLQGVIHESAKNISKVLGRSSKIYNNVIKGLSMSAACYLAKNGHNVTIISFNHYCSTINSHFMW